MALDLSDLTDDQQAALQALANGQGPTQMADASATAPVADPNAAVPPPQAAPVDPNAQPVPTPVPAQAMPPQAAPVDPNAAAVPVVDPNAQAVPAPVPPAVVPPDDSWDTGQAQAPASPNAPTAAPSQAAAAPPAIPAAGAQPIANPATVVPVTSSNFNDYNQRLAMMESGNTPDAKNPNSSATGTYQITAPTLADLVAKHPVLQGLSVNDPQVINALNSDNNAYLTKALGRSPNMIEMYAAHFLGAAGAVKFLNSDPNTPAVNVVSADQVAANKGVFYNQDGTPKTVGQIYNSVAQRMGSDQLMANNGGSNGQNPPNGQSNGSSGTNYGQILADYIKSQPGMWQKMQEMQQQLMNSTKPTAWDTIDDALNKWGTLHNTAMANKLASTGGVLMHNLPDPKPFNDAMAQAQATTMAARQANIQRAQMGSQMGMQQILAQMAQGGQNVSLASEGQKLAQSQQGLGIEQQKANQEGQRNQLEAQKFNQDQNNQVLSSLDKSVTNLPVQNQIRQEFLSQYDPKSSVQAQQQLLANITAQHAAKGDQLITKVPDQPMNINYTMPDPNDATKKIVKVEGVNLATGGQARFDELKKFGYDPQYASPATPTTTINPVINNNPPGAGGSEGGGKTLSPGDQYKSLARVSSLAGGVNQILDEMKARGTSTGPLNMSPTGLHIAAVIQQVTGADASNLTLQQALNTVLTQLGNDITLPQLKGLGRSTEVEFNRIGQGLASGTLTPDAIRSSMGGVIANAQHDMKDISDSNAADLYNQKNHIVTYPADIEQRKIDQVTTNPLPAPVNWNLLKPQQTGPTPDPVRPPGVDPAAKYSPSQKGWWLNGKQVG